VECHVGNRLSVHLDDPSPECLVPEEQGSEVSVREIGRVAIESMNALGYPHQVIGIGVASIA
jgi:hypothetical protein